MKKFIAEDFFKFCNDGFSSYPIAQPQFNAIDLICQYWHNKYHTNMIQPFESYDRDDPGCDPQPYYPLYSEHLNLDDIRGYIEDARKQPGNYRLAFLIGAKHALFMVYIKEGDNEAILYADSLGEGVHRLNDIKEKFGIEVFTIAGDFTRQADNYSCFNDALVMGRDTTAIEPQTGEYRIKNLIAVLEQRVVKEKNGIFYTKLPSQLLKTAQISEFVNFHKEEDRTIKIHKNLTLDEFRVKYNKQYLRGVGIKFIKKAEIQFYINEMETVLGGLFHNEKNEFINSAKKSLKAQPEADLYSLANEFLKSLKSNRSECKQEVIEQTSLSPKRECLKEFEKEIGKTINMFKRAAQSGNIDVARALLDDQSLISKLIKTGYLWECANTDAFFAKELFSKYSQSFTEGEIKALKWRIQHHYRSYLYEEMVLTNTKESTDNSLQDTAEGVRQPENLVQSDKKISQIGQSSFFTNEQAKVDTSHKVVESHRGVYPLPF